MRHMVWLPTTLPWREAIRRLLNTTTPRNGILPYARPLSTWLTTTSTHLDSRMPPKKFGTCS